MPIGFFDSGVGGLTVFEKLKKLLPSEDYLYFGDTKNMPYGEKSEEQLLEFADKIFRFFEAKNVKCVVMACNTTSAVVYEKLKDNYNFKIYPIIQSVTSILGQLPIEKIGIFATKATVNSGVYSSEINKHNPQMEVCEIACPQWVKIVEEGIETDIESVECVKTMLDKMLEFNPQKIVLGCTHYPYLLPILSKYSPPDTFIDPSKYFAEFIKEDLRKNDLLNNKEILKQVQDDVCGARHYEEDKVRRGNLTPCDCHANARNDETNGSEKFFVSSSPENFHKASTMFYEIKKLPELIDL